MKKYLILFYALLIGFSAFAFRPVEIDEKLVQTFKTAFPDAQMVVWGESEDSYTVSFVDHGIRVKAVYKKDGSSTEFTRYYEADNLPFYVQYRVKKRYPTKRIYGVIELLTLSSPGNHLAVEYYIKLEDEKHWMTLKMDSDKNLLVVEKYKKAE